MDRGPRVGPRRIDDDLPFDVAALVGCAVATGWGSAVRLGEVRPGEHVVVVGTGGVGLNAVQGAAGAGAATVVAVDTNAGKRDQALLFGATHATASPAEAQVLGPVTKGRLADVALLSVGVGDGEIVTELLRLLGKGGRCVLTSVPGRGATLGVPFADFALQEKVLRGNVFGGLSAHHDIPLLLSLYRAGKLKLDELITARYPLEDINVGYADMHAGRNIRGVVDHVH